MQGAKVLLGLLLLLLPPGWPVLIGIDETIERRSGKRMNVAVESGSSVSRCAATLRESL